MRTLGLFWPGFLTELYKAAQCTPYTAATLGVFDAKYRPDGRIAGAAIGQAVQSSGCLRALKILAQLTIADPSEPVSGQALIVVPLDRDYAECVSGPAIEETTQVGWPDGSGGRIKTPRKTRDDRPVYPNELMERRIGGTIMLEAVVSSTGCVATVRVFRGRPELAFSVVRAVTRWRFTPPIVDGRPMPIMVTATINFKLP